MKIINLKAPLSVQELIDYLQPRVSTEFKERRHLDLEFDFRVIGNAIEIGQGELYEGFLFRLELTGNELTITKSEHYTDDVNVLTLEDLINNSLTDYPLKDDIDFIGERS